MDEGGFAFDWDRDYGPLYRACPSAFWLAPEPGERKRDVIDIRPKMTTLPSASLNQLAMMQSQMSPYASQGLINSYGALGILGLGRLFG